MGRTVAEIERQLAALREELADARRAERADRAAQPPGDAQVVSDYTLRTPEGAAVTLRSLFGAKQDLILIHNMGRSCVYCTLWADGFIGLARHVQDRAAFVLASPDEPAVLKDFAASRGWPFRCVSFAGTSLAADLGYERTLPDGTKQPLPGVSALHLTPETGAISRAGTAPFGPGDAFCALWPMLELLRGGPSGWTPKYDYGPAAGAFVQVGRA